MDMGGVKTGRLTVLRKVEKHEQRGDKIWECVCDCGNLTLASVYQILSGTYKSCGCLRKEDNIKGQTKHGYGGRINRKPEYSVWNAMIQRCYNINHDQFHDYGGRGISVCIEWLLFDNFIMDMGDRPTNKHTPDRFPNNDGNYEKSNCRWATWAEQVRGKRSNVWIEYNGDRKCQKDWASLLGVRDDSISTFLKKGRTFEWIYNHFKSKNYISQNRKASIWYEHNGENKCQADWAKELKVSFNSISYHIKREKSFEWVYNYFKK